MSLRAIGETLTAEGYRTKRGSDTWHPGVVARIVSRSEMAKAMAALEEAT